MNNKKEKLYIETVIWAYERHQEGFTLDDRKKSIGLSDEDWLWWREMFITTNGNDRKMIDLYRREEDGNLSGYTLNDKGMSVVIDYTTLEEARSSGRKAVWFAGVSILIGAAALVVSFVTGWLTYRSVQMAIEPQVDIYVQQVDGSNEEYMEYIVGIENNGVVPIKDVSATLQTANILKGGCKSEASCGGFAGTGIIVVEKEKRIPVLKPLETKQGAIFLFPRLDEAKYVQVISISLSYLRDIDKRKGTETMTFVVDDFRIYTLEEVKDRKSMEPFISTYRELTARASSMNNKIYWSDNAWR